MNETKVSVSILLPGSIMFTQEEAETLEKEQSKSGFEAQTQVLKKGKEINTIHYLTRKYRPARQSLKLCKEAFFYMTDRLACPEWETQKKWSSMSKKQRLESHLQRITEHLGGKSYTYQVFED